MKKSVLYVDIAFEGIKGGDKNRSKFIWNTINSEYDCDILLVSMGDEIDSSLYENYGKLFTLEATEGKFPSPKSIYHFDKTNKNKFQKIITDNNYEFILFRFLSHYQLTKIARKQSKVVVDVDMLFSKIASLSWNSNRSLKNRYYFFELLKLTIFERKVFKKPYLFLFTNDKEMAEIKKQNSYNVQLKLFHNFMPEIHRKKSIRNREILFFGTLNSAANIDAFNFLIEDIYPKIESRLVEHNIKIIVAGKNKTEHYKRADALSNIEVIGEVDNLHERINRSLLVFLPLRVASGTRTRILEAAANSTMVVTTAIGVEGLGLEDSVLMGNCADDFVKIFDYVNDNRGIIKEYEEKIYQASCKTFSTATIKEHFINDVTTFINRKRIAIVLNRFYPEVGGAETNLLFQAQELAKKHDITIYTPKRDSVASVEYKDDFKIVRLFNLLNPKRVFPDIKSKTFLPGLLCHLVINRYDVIQVFPSLNYNSILAFIIAKIKRVPYIFCSFDFLDYASIINSSNGSIDPSMILQYKPTLREKFLLKHCDHIFAISEREITFFKQFNKKVSYSPVPVSTEEYEKECSDIRTSMKLQDQFLFLSLGRISSIKGQDMALDAFIKVAETIENSSLLFVGRDDYEPKFVAKLKRKISEHKLEQRVKFTGMVSRDEVISWLTYADIHVIPVRFMNSGAVVVESWAAGTPVIQSDAVDPNFVIDGRNGYLFASTDSSQLSQKMVEAYENRDKLTSMAQEGKKFVLEKITYPVLIENYEAVYDELCSQKKMRKI